MTELISLDRFRSELRAGAKPAMGVGCAVVRVSVGAPQLVDEASRKIRFCFSDGTVDRMGDAIAPDGWVVDSFMRNPVALWAHDALSPPIGRASNIAVEGERLMGDIEFAAADIYPFAETIYRMVKGGYINAVSVGFLPVEYSWSSDKEREFGIDFERQELLEISVVPVPANANALIEARAKGIDVRPLIDWAERTLEGGGKVILPKTELDRLIAGHGAASVEEKFAMNDKGLRGRRRGVDGNPMAEGEMAETDPAAGGFLGDCGRSAEEECGMKNPMECAVHGPALLAAGGSDGGKALRAVFRELRALRAALPLVLRGGEAGNAPDTGEDPLHGPLPKALEHVEAAHKAMKDLIIIDPDDDEEAHQECMRSMHAHVKAADHYLERHRSESVGDDPHTITLPNPEAERAARVARAQRLRAVS